MSDDYQPAPEYQSAHTRAVWSMYLLAGCLIIKIVSLWYEYKVLDITTRFHNGQKITQAELFGLNRQFIIVDGLTLILMVSTAVVILSWIYRSHKNLEALGVRETRFTPGWAVGWFFVPIWHLVRPYQIAEEIRAASNPDIIDPTAWKEHQTSVMVRGWWACYILNGFASYIAVQGAKDFGSIAVGIGMAGSLLAIVSAVLGIIMIRDIDNRQSAKHDRLRIMNSASPQ